MTGTADDWCQSEMEFRRRTGRIRRMRLNRRYHIRRDAEERRKPPDQNPTKSPKEGDSFKEGQVVWFKLSEQIKGVGRIRGLAPSLDGQNLQWIVDIESEGRTAKIPTDVYPWSCITVPYYSFVEELAFPYRELYDLHAKGEQEAAIDLIHACLTEAQEYDAFNWIYHIFNWIELSKIDSTLALAFLSATCACAKQVANRSCYFRRVQNWLPSQGYSPKEVEALLAGLE